MTDAPKLPPAYRVIALDAVDSTNEEAKRRARAGAEDGALIWAREQTAGRGRSGHKWDSPRGNLYFSLILRPECAAAEAAQLSFVAAVAVNETLATLLPPLFDVRFKWPNDILLNDRKVGGLLLETEGAGRGTLDWLVLGIGINLVSHPERTPFPATDLRFETGSAFPPEAALEAFGRFFQSWANCWLDEGFAPIREAWKARAKGIGESIIVRLPRQRLRGTFADLDGDGALLLDLPQDGRRRVTAGEVFFDMV